MLGEDARWTAVRGVCRPAVRRAAASCAVAPATAHRHARAHGPQKRESNAQQGEGKRDNGTRHDGNYAPTSSNGAGSNNGNGAWAAALAVDDAPTPYAIDSIRSSDNPDYENTVDVDVRCPVLVPLLSQSPPKGTLWGVVKA